MILDKKINSKLKEIGLNTYESKVWTALLSRGVSTAGELSDIANVPRSRSYDVLESLEKKGFVTMKVGKPIKYIAVPPAEAIERVKKRILQNAKEEEAKLEDIKTSDILAELTNLHNLGIETQDPTEITGSLKGSENIYLHLEYMLKTAKERANIVTTEKGLIKKSAELFKQIKKARENGIEITITAPLTDANKEAQQKLSNYVTFKNAEKNESRFMIVDNKHVAVFLTNEKEVHPSYELAIWTTSPNLAKTLLSSI